MIEILSVVLSKIAEAFIGVLVSKLTDEVRSKLQGDPAKNAIKRALGAAIQRYATSGLRLDLARPLLEKDGFLTLPSVAEELTQLVRFEREPDTELIGQKWKASMDGHPPWSNFNDEAKRLLEYFQVELRGTEIFRPVFNAKSLDAIATNVASSTESLAHIEAQLADLAQMMGTRFSELIHAFEGASFNIREQIRDYTRFIKEKTHDFVGRQFVFDAVTHFTETNPRGYYFIRGDPGIGKSALAAQMVKTNGYVHHFNIRSEGINKADTFLRNICAQLIVVHHLEHTFLPPETTQDSGFLNRLLGEVSDKLGPDEKAIIVVDALDEVDTLGLSLGANTLYLPLTLPQGIYIIATMRRIPIDLRIECEQDTLDIVHDSAGNIADIREYVEQATERPGIQAYIASKGIDNKLFIAYLVEKSGGNFMYLRYVLPEIEHGAYTDLGLNSLPAGLQNYYEDHWRRMGMTSTPLPRTKINIVYILAEVRQLTSRRLIAEYAKTDELTVQEVLNAWDQFLHKQLVEREIRYSIYHASFQDFLHRKDTVQLADVTIEDINTLIAQNLLQKLLGKE